MGNILQTYNRIFIYSFFVLALDKYSEPDSDSVTFMLVSCMSILQPYDWKSDTQFNETN